MERSEFKNKVYSGGKKRYVDSSFHQSRIKPVLNWIKEEMLRKGRGLKILDVGCGTGEVSKLFIDLGNEVYGTDAVTSALREAKKRGVKVKRCDVEKGLQYPENSFDVVFAGQILEHIYDTENFLKECKRVLKKGGILIITTPNIASLPSRIRLFFGFYPRWVAPSLSHYQPADHIRAFTLGVLKKLVESAGFKVEKVTSNLVSFLPTRRTSPPWSCFLGRIFPSLGEILILKARR
ncbi:MAG: class I SAM-dependent methyltransferase [Candidatus Micrarchaeota archaeon]|nr:class I SAM-dependent methyltransferase [Candidatus Micrarchaeota archaeon]